MKNLFTLFTGLIVYTLSFAQPGTVLSHQKISQTMGGFAATLVDSDRFGEAIANIGDLNGDGIDDLAVGAVGTDDGGTNKGAVYILFMNADGTVASHQKISDTDGGFGGVLAGPGFCGPRHRKGLA